jgi:hypothetical protein
VSARATGGKPEEEHKRTLGHREWTQKDSMGSQARHCKRPYRWSVDGGRNATSRCSLSSITTYETDFKPSYGIKSIYLLDEFLKNGSSPFLRSYGPRPLLTVPGVRVQLAAAFAKGGAAAVRPVERAEERTQLATPSTPVEATRRLPPSYTRRPLSHAASASPRRRSREDRSRASERSAAISPQPRGRQRRTTHTRAATAREGDTHRTHSSS